MFSIVNAVLLRPLPYPQQERLIELVHTSPTVKELFASSAIYFGYRDYGQAFEAVGYWNWAASPVTVSGRGEPESVPSVEVTHEVLRILGATAIVGRTFKASDNAPAAARTMVVSFDYWQRQFGSADSIGGGSSWAASHGRSSECCRARSASSTTTPISICPCSSIAPRHNSPDSLAAPSLCSSRDSHWRRLRPTPRG